jgi:peptide/nickel transport system substrate-binding protein
MRIPTTSPVRRGGPGSGRPHGRRLAVVAISALLAIAGSAIVPVAAQSPVSGGVLRFARNQEPGTLNPIGCGDNGCIWALTQIFDQLVDVTADGLEPGLAESWTSSDDGTVWTFNLRDAKFSNGDPVTAEDVKFSLDRFADPEINAAYSGVAASIKSVDITDPKTITITLDHPDGAILEDLAMFVPSIIDKSVYEAVGDEAYGSSPVGSGPFMVKSFNRGQSLELVRNPYYWKSGQPYLDGVTFAFVPDDNTRILQLQNGEADVAAEIPYSQVAQVDAADGITVNVEDILTWDALWLNNSRKPLDEAAVRQALAYATPREDMLQSVLFGNAEVANSVIAKGKYWSKDVPAYTFDLDKAKELLATSSVPNGFPMEMLVVAGDTVERQEAEIIKEAWSQIGVDLTIRPVDIGTAFDEWFGGNVDAATFPGNTLSSDTLSDDNLAQVFYDTSGGANSFGTGYSNPEVAAILKDATQTQDEAVRAADFARMQTVTMADAESVPLFFTKARTGLSDKVQGFRTVQPGWWDLENVWLQP